jgi:PAS domain S-box-containing protein
VDLDDKKFSPQEIIDALPHFVWGKDVEGKYVVANLAYSKVCGRSVAEIVGKSDLDLFPKEVAELHTLNENEIYRTKDHKKIEEEKTVNGNKVWYEVFLQPVIEGEKVIGIIAEGHEITGRKNIQKEISDVKERYEELVDNLMVGVYRNTPGPTGHFLEANPAIIQMFEAGTKEEFLKHNVSELYVDPAKRKEFSDKMMANGFLKAEELELKTLKTGKVFWGSVTAIMKKDEKGEVYFDGIIEDITERSMAEKELKEKMAELERMNALMINRELKMSELKEEIERIKNTK